MKGHNTGVYLMSCKVTRACIDGDLYAIRKNETLWFEVPASLSGVPSEVFNRREAWSHKAKYDAATNKLAGMFANNFKDFVQPGMTDD